MELILSDLVVVEKRWSGWRRIARRSRTPNSIGNTSCLVKCKAALEDKHSSAAAWNLMPEEEKRIRGFQFLSQKPMLYVLNLGEEEAARLHEMRTGVSQRSLGGTAANRRSPRYAAKSRPSSQNCRPKRQREYLASYGLTESGLERLIRPHTRLLGLDVVPDRRRDRGARLDHPDEQHGSEGGGRHPQRFREEVHSRRGGELEVAGGLWRIPWRARERICCGWRARSTSSKMAMCW